MRWCSKSSASPIRLESLSGAVPIGDKLHQERGLLPPWAMNEEENLASEEEILVEDILPFDDDDMFDEEPTIDDFEFESEGLTFD